MNVFIKDQQKRLKMLLNTNPAYLKKLLLNMEYNSILQMSESEIKTVLKVKHNRGIREKLIEQRHKIWEQAFNQDLVEEIVLPLIVEKSKVVRVEEYKDCFIFEEKMH